MKIKFVRGAVIGAVLLVGVAVAVGAAARSNQGGHWGHGFGGPPNADMMVAHMTKALGLSDAQATQVKQIFADQQGRVEPLMARMKDADTQLRAATENGQFDEAKVREIAAQKAAVMTDMIVEHARTHAAIYQVLTPDQREKASKWGPGEGGPERGPHGMGQGF